MPNKKYFQQTDKLHSLKMLNSMMHAILPIATITYPSPNDHLCYQIYMTVTVRGRSAMVIVCVMLNCALAVHVL